MRILDSNLLIYSAQEHFVFLRSLIKQPHTYLSAASKVETLGYHKLTSDERTYFEDIFKVTTVIGITDSIVDKAVELRQQRKMSFGDCIIAATALLHGLDLYTNNVEDFSHISGLVVINPMTV